MGKLSELSLETMLTVQHQSDGDCDCMTKRDYLNSAYFLDYPVEPFTKVTVAEKSVVTFDFYDALYWLGEGETHEYWCDDVTRDLSNLYPEIDALTAKINEVLSNNPSYWEGEPVEIDLLPSEAEMPEPAKEE